jgi:hypothetical protein
MSEPVYFAEVASPAPAAAAPSPAAPAPAAANNLTNKPIQKRQVEDLDLDDDDHSRGARGLQVGEAFSPTELHRIEGTARSNLNQYLQSKGVDVKYGAEFKIHIRKSNSNQSGYATSYSDREGRVYNAKMEVYNAIMVAKRSRTATASQRRHSMSRKEMFDTAKMTYGGKAFPAVLDGLKVVSLGTVNTSVVFHSPVNIYPVGYKCEQMVNNTKEDQLVCCEIGLLDGLPQFCITVQATGDTFLATSEAGVWKKVGRYRASLFLPR